MLYKDSEEERIGEFLILMKILTREQVRSILVRQYPSICSQSQPYLSAPICLSYEKQYPLFQRDKNYIKKARN